MRIFYRSGLCSPVSRISRMRSRYWYSSCLEIWFEMSGFPVCVMDAEGADSDSSEGVIFA